MQCSASPFGPHSNISTISNDKTQQQKTKKKNSAQAHTHAHTHATRFIPMLDPPAQHVSIYHRRGEGTTTLRCLCPRFTPPPPPVFLLIFASLPPHTGSIHFFLSLSLHRMHPFRLHFSLHICLYFFISFSSRFQTLLPELWNFLSRAGPSVRRRVRRAQRALPALAFSLQLLRQLL